MAKKKEKKKGPVVHMFDPEIYPRKLFVMKGNKLEEYIKDTFRCITDDGEETEPGFEGVDMSGACTWSRVMYRKDGKLGVLVWIRSSRCGKDLAHEADHVTNSIFADCGIDMHYKHDEHHAYMIGWCYDCLEQVLKNRFKY